MSKTPSPKKGKLSSQESKTSEILLENIPMLPLNNMVSLPGDVSNFNLHHEGLITAIKTAYQNNIPIFTFPSNKKTAKGEPHFGTLADIVEILEPDANKGFRFRLKFTQRAEWVGLQSSKDSSIGQVRQIPRELRPHSTAFKAWCSEVNTSLKVLHKQVPQCPSKIEVENLEELELFFGQCARVLKFSTQDRFELLQGWSLKKRMEHFLVQLGEQIQIHQLRKGLQDKTQHRIQRMEKETFLHEEKRLIEKELGLQSKMDDPLDLETRIQDFEGPDHVQEQLSREYTRLQRSGPNSPQSAILQDYIETLLDLPWSQPAANRPAWNQVERRLKQSHFGLEKVKERVLEHLAIEHLAQKPVGPILCFIGPPGVGKTSMAKAIAEALNLPYIKKSLGGVHDEAEIRGHRRTYVGAMPGRIIQGLRKVKCSNPLFLLDEVDKLGRDQRGSPADALLEVLDPEENHRFSDHYVELEFDLSKVFWVLTANNESAIPHALHDRLEIIRYSGYTEDEKVHISREYLLDRNLKKLGLQKKALFSIPQAKELIRHYTREPGVRELDRQVASVLRHLALEEARKKSRLRWTFSKPQIQKALGPPKFKRPSWTAKSWAPGVLPGLAWTIAGGLVLRTECSLMTGKKQLKLTGKMGEVMQESAHIAFSYLRNQAEELGIDTKTLNENDIHIHIPSGAVSKEGPSAGLALALVMYSALKSKKPRTYWALSGEISLHGRVLAVGGIKEKVLAAQQEGFEGVVLPKANEQDISEIPKRELGSLKIRFVQHFNEARDWFFPESPRAQRKRQKRS